MTPFWTATVDSTDTAAIQTQLRTQLNDTTSDYIALSQGDNLLIVRKTGGAFTTTSSITPATPVYASVYQSSSVPQSQWSHQIAFTGGDPATGASASGDIWKLYLAGDTTAYQFLPGSAGLDAVAAGFPEHFVS